MSLPRKYWFVLLLLMVIIVPLARSGIRAFDRMNGQQIVGLEVIRRHWEPHPVLTGCGVLYVWAEGTEADLAIAQTPGIELTLCQQPIEGRFQHSACSQSWWQPATDPSQVLCGSTLDGPALPFAGFDFEFVISATSSGVFYEQRTVPKKRRGAKLSVGDLRASEFPRKGHPGIL